jgi:hypothetical protein
MSSKLPAISDYPRAHICTRPAPSELQGSSAPGATVFSHNTSRLQSALHGSKRKVEVASARRKLPDDESTLPRLLTAVYTPLLRCATASDACNFACGHGLSKRGAASGSPFRIFGIASDAGIRPALKTVLMSFKEAGSEDERCGASPRVESAGNRALGSKVFVVCVALAGTDVCLQECSRVGDWDAFEHDS